MNKIKIMFAVLFAAILMILTGCQSVFEITKNPEQMHPIHKVVTVNGQEEKVVDHYERSSGGYNGYYRAPLWSTEQLRGVKVSVSTNGTFTFEIDDYKKDLSTNSVVMVEKMFSGGAQLAIAIGDAYTKIAGGGAQADTVANLTARAYNFFKSKGGKVESAKVTLDEPSKKFTIDDGSTCVECSVDGTCTECSYRPDGSSSE